MNENMNMSTNTNTPTQQLPFWPAQGWVQRHPRAHWETNRVYRLRLELCAAHYETQDSIAEAMRKGRRNRV